MTGIERFVGAAAAIEESIALELKRLGLGSALEIWLKEWAKGIDPIRMRRNDKDRIALNHLSQDTLIMEWRVRRFIALASIFQRQDDSIHHLNQPFFQTFGRNDYCWMYIDSAYAAIYSAWNRVAGTVNVIWPAKKSKDVFPSDVISALRIPLRGKNSKSLVKLERYFEDGFSFGVNSIRRRTVHSFSNSARNLFEYLDCHQDARKFEQFKMSPRIRLKRLIREYKEMVRMVPVVYRIAGDCHRRGLT